MLLQEMKDLVLYFCYILFFALKDINSMVIIQYEDYTYLLAHDFVGKKCSKAPKIQRLVTPLTLQRKRARIAEKEKRIDKAKSEAAEYQKLLASRLKEQREQRSESLTKRRSKLSAASKAKAFNRRVNISFTIHQVT